MRNIFLLLFAISVFSFLIFYYQLHDSYYYIGSMHLGIFSIAMYFIYDKSWKNTLKKLGIPGDLKRNAVYTVGGIVALFATVFILNIVFYFTGLEDGTKVYDIVKDLPWYLLIFAIIAAPISEELFFRALLTDKFGIVISSIAFSLSHAAYGSISQLTGAFFLGAILAVIYKKSGSIIPCMIIHGFFNAIAIVFMKLVTG